MKPRALTLLKLHLASRTRHGLNCLSTVLRYQRQYSGWNMHEYMSWSITLLGLGVRNKVKTDIANIFLISHEEASNVANGFDQNFLFARIKILYHIVYVSWISEKIIRKTRITYISVITSFGRIPPWAIPPPTPDHPLIWWIFWWLGLSLSGIMTSEYETKATCSGRRPHFSSQ